MGILLEPGDIFLTRSCSLISKAIRFFTRSIGEKRTKVNHVGIVVQRGDIKTAIGVEALSKVVRHTLWSQECQGDGSYDNKIQKELVRICKILRYI